MGRCLPLDLFAAARLRLRSLGDSMIRFLYSNDFRGRRSTCICLLFRDADRFEVFFVVDVCWSESDLDRFVHILRKLRSTGSYCPGPILYWSRCFSPCRRNAFKSGLSNLFCWWDAFLLSDLSCLRSTSTGLL